MQISTKLCVSVMVVCVFGAAADAASTVYDGVYPFTATDIPGGFFSGFDVTTSGKVIGLAGRKIELYSSSGVWERTVATVPDWNGENSPEWGAFCRLSPDESAVWVGLTVMGNNDDRIYSAPFAGGAATHQATLYANYDLEFRMVGGDWKPFVSGSNRSNWADPCATWLLDTSGADNHLKVAELGGYGTGIAFDSVGSLYAMNQTTRKLYRFAAADVQNVIDGVTEPLVGDNADFSTDMHFAGSDMTTDGADHVFFNSNDPTWSGASLVSMLQTGYAGAYQYDNIATGCGSFGNWSTQLAFGGGTGDVLLEGGSVYAADYWSAGGVTELAVPEPASIALVSAGLVLLGSVFRRRMK